MNLTALSYRLKHTGQRTLQRLLHKDVCLTRPNLSHLAQKPDQLPFFVKESAVAMRYLRFLGPLDWDRFPTRAIKRQPMIEPPPYAPFSAPARPRTNPETAGHNLFCASKPGIIIPLTSDWHGVAWFQVDFTFAILRRNLVTNRLQFFVTLSFPPSRDSCSFLRGYGG